MLGKKQCYSVEFKFKVIQAIKKDSILPKQRAFTLISPIQG
ncbi:hypothetical protein AVEN109717_08155 [Avibacterium endocarditidis]